VAEATKAFGHAIREARANRKLSQEQLAFDCGFDRTYISLVERGLRSPTIRSLVRMAEVLEVSPSSIVARMEVLLSSPNPKGKS
jgi:transcriptional regulator with XRE-family HTH domain